MKRRNPIGDLEAAVFDTLAETTQIARRLALACRMNQTLALMLAEVRGREGSRLLTALLKAEHPPRRKVSKGAKNGPRPR